MVSPVIPGSYRTDRADLQEAIVALVDAFIAANPTVVRKMWHTMPANLMGEGPFVAIGSISEVVRHTESLRIRVFEGAIAYVDVMTDNLEVDDRINVFSDMMADLFTLNARILPVGMLEQTGFEEGELQQGPVRMAAPTLTWRYTVQTGDTGY